MPGKGTAPKAGRLLEDRVAEIGRKLKLKVRRRIRVGKRLWGTAREIDVVLTHVKTRKSLGIECKFQGGGGTADEKIPTTIKDIEAWPIPGIVVLGGQGFREHLRSYFYSTGKAVDVEDLEDWLRARQRISPRFRRWPSGTM